VFFDLHTGHCGLDVAAGRVADCSFLENQVVDPVLDSQKATGLVLEEVSSVGYNEWFFPAETGLVEVVGPLTVGDVEPELVVEASRVISIHLDAEAHGRHRVVHSIINILHIGLEGSRTLEHSGLEVELTFYFTLDLSEYPIVTGPILYHSHIGGHVFTHTGLDHVDSSHSQVFSILE